MAARSRRRSTAARNGLQLCGRPTKPLGRAGWAFKKKQLEEVRGGVRRSLPARGSNPNIAAGRGRASSAARSSFNGPSPSRRSFPWVLGATKQGRAWRGDGFAGCGRPKAVRRRSGPHGPRGGGVERTALTASRRRSGAQAPLRRRGGRPERQLERCAWDLGGRTACGRELGGCRMRERVGVVGSC
jgi:hypothetical protein